MKITIDKQALQAVSYFSGVKDIRFYLNGVFVQANEMQTRLIATDGSTMAAHRMDAKDENTGAAEFIIPLDAVKTMVKWKAARFNEWAITLTLPEPFTLDSEIRAEFAGNVILFRQIDGKFPEFSRVIPSECSGEYAHFNPEYLMRLQDAAKCFEKKALMVPFAMNGTGPALAQINHSMIAVIMPLRMEQKIDVAECQWAKQELPKVSDVPDVVAVVSDEVA